MKLQKITTALLIAATFLSGILLIFFGTGGAASKIKQTGDYEKAEGYYFTYDIATPAKHNSDGSISPATHYLKYYFYVDGTEYVATSSKETRDTPLYGTEVEIRYNPANPNENAVIDGNSAENKTLTLLGACFIGFGVLFLAARLIDRISQSIQFNYVKFVMGAFASSFSYAFLGLMCKALSPKEILIAFKTDFSILAVVPLMLLAAGLYMMVSSIFEKQPKDE